MKRNMRVDIKFKKLTVGILFFVLYTLMFSMSVSAAETTLKNKKWVSGECGTFVDKDEDGLRETFQKNDPAYYKIKASGTGTIVIEAKMSQLPGEKEYNEHWNDEDEHWPEEYSMNISVLDSKKNVILNHTFESRVIFSQIVKKNTNYYLKVTGNCKYKIRYSYFSAPSKISRPSHEIKKAVLLKRGIAVNSFIDVDGKGDLEDSYYKFETKKQAGVTLSFNTHIRGGLFESGGDNLEVVLYCKKGNQYRQVDEKGRLRDKDLFLWWDVSGKDKLNFKLPKGTYFIRLFSYEGTGYYSIKWN